jgi:hypothetical protein
LKHLGARELQPSSPVRLVHCGTPAQRNRNTPHSSPEIKSSRIRHCLA